MLLQIYNLDAVPEEAPVCTLSSGEHVIGRGDLLECHDKRASRTHGIIKIENNSVTITSTHQNPCFYQSAESTTVVILTQNSPTEIKDGDKFGMFPDQFWFKTKFLFDVEVPDEDKGLVGETLAIKRQAEGDSNEPLQSKIPKLESPSGNNETTITSPVNGASLVENRGVTNGDAKEVLSDSSVETEAAENLLTNENEVNTLNNIDEAKAETEECVEGGSSTANTDDQVASSSGTAANQDEDDSSKKLRDRCWYAGNCYRKSTHHKQEFSHPGDPDYDSDPSDVRPICQYGAKCYRKNKDHLKQFKHPRTTRKPPKRRERKKRKDPKKAKTTTNESSEDDYDYDDPFLDDNSEDDYQEESWSEDDSDDEDWAESGDEDTGSLMKEAKRFMKQKKE